MEKRVEREKNEVEIARKVKVYRRIGSGMPSKV